MFMIYLNTEFGMLSSYGLSSSSSPKHYSLLSLRLPLCDLFNDTVSSSDCKALIDRMITD